jgi:hypothetical protein
MRPISDRPAHRSEPQTLAGLPEVSESRRRSHILPYTTAHSFGAAAEGGDTPKGNNPGTGVLHFPVSDQTRTNHPRRYNAQAIRNITSTYETA